MLREIKKPQGIRAYSFLMVGCMGVGKTSSLNTIPGHTLVVNYESRNPFNQLSKQDVDVVGGYHYKDLLDFLLKAHRELIKTGELSHNGAVVHNVFFDSLHELQAVTHRDTMLGRQELTVLEVKEKLAKERDVLKTQVNDNVLISSNASLERAEWMSTANELRRVISLLNKLTNYGINIFATALSTGSASYNKALVEAPAFQGKAFADYATSYFDGVCLVRSRTKVDDKGAVTTVYPPAALWDSPDKSFEAKKPIAGFPNRCSLDWSKILEEIARLKKEVTGEEISA